MSLAFRPLVYELRRLTGMFECERDPAKREATLGQLLDVLDRNEYRGFLYGTEGIYRAEPASSDLPLIVSAQDIALTPKPIVIGPETPSVPGSEFSYFIDGNKVSIPGYEAQAMLRRVYVDVKPGTPQTVPRWLGVRHSLGLFQAVYTSPDLVLRSSFSSSPTGLEKELSAILYLMQGSCLTPLLPRRIKRDMH